MVRSDHLNVYSVCQSSSRGRYLASTIPVPSGSLLFTETPICQTQSPSNKLSVVACEYCGQLLDLPLGDVLDAATDTGARERIYAGLDDSIGTAKCTAVKCRWDCGVLFCSESCEDKANSTPTCALPTTES